MKGKLVRLQSTNNNLRTKEIEGEFIVPPVIGAPFRIYGESLSFKGGIRFIETSNVQTVETLSDRIRFTTLNSTYELL